MTCLFEFTPVSLLRSFNRMHAPFLVSFFMQQTHSTRTLHNGAAMRYFIIVSLFYNHFNVELYSYHLKHLIQFDWTPILSLSLSLHPYHSINLHHLWYMRIELFEKLLQICKFKCKYDNGAQKLVQVWVCVNTQAFYFFYY